MARTSAYLLLLLILFHVISNTVIVARHNTPLQADAAQFLRASLEMNDRLLAGNIRGALQIHDRYGPLFFYLTQPFYFLLGRSLASAVFINNIFFALLLAGIFFLGRELFSEKAGLLAAALISFYPQVYGMSRVYIFDFALTAMICLDLYLLARTRHFTDRRFSKFLGIALGLSALIKPVFVLFVIGPVLIVLLMKLQPGKKSPGMRGRAKNFLRTLVISLLLYSMWFLGNYRSILQDAKRTITIDFTGGAYHYIDLNNALYWPKIVGSYQVLYLFAALFVAAIVWFLAARKITPQTKLSLLSFFAIPYLFFTFIVLNNKDPRFILPLTIGISLVSAACLASIQPTWLRGGAIALVVAVGLWQYWVLCYGGMNYCNEESGVFSEYFHLFAGMDGAREWHNGIFRSSITSQGLDAVLVVLADDARGGAQERIVLATRYFFTPIEYLKHLKDTRNLGFQLFANPEIFPEHYSREPDYFLIMNGQDDGGHCLGEPRAGELESIRLFEDQKESYNLLESIPSYPCASPCGETGHTNSIDIYKRVE